VLGAKAVQRTHPWDEPRTERAAGGSRMPTFRIGSRGIVGRELRTEAAREVTWFRKTHEEVRLARRDGDLTRVFPHGTYGARVFDGAPVALEAPVGAILTRPGPTLADVKAELAREALDREALRARSIAIVDEVREALCDEAPELVAHASVDFEAKKEHAPTGGDVTRSAEERTPLVTRHRFDRGRADRDLARRIVTLRDRRRGRPPRGGGGPHGSDPPV
jgi:hypothetical protein